MKIAITADVHLANHREFSRILPDGTNSRLLDGVKALKQVSDTSEAEVLVIAGDLFHDQETIDVSVLMAASEVIGYVAGNHQMVVILVGNHDQYLTNGKIHSLAQFSRYPNVHVIDKPEYFDPLDCIMMPYIRNYEVWGAEWQRLTTAHPAAERAFLHADIIGAEMNGGFTSGKGVQLPQLVESNIPVIVSGHFHKPQKLYDVDGCSCYYVGSPYQLDRAESGQKKRYLLIDEDNRVESRVITGLPEFRKAKSVEDAKSNDHKGHFVDVTCSMQEATEIVKSGKDATMNLIVSKPNDDQVYTDYVPLGIVDALKTDLEKRGRSDLFEKALSRLKSST